MSKIIPKNIFTRVTLCAFIACFSFVIYAAPSDSFNSTPFVIKTGRVVEQPGRDHRSIPVCVRPNLDLLQKFNHPELQREPAPIPQEVPKKVSLKQKESYVDWRYELISGMKLFEGFKSKRYICPGGVPTIGYGATNPKVVARGYISKQEATRILLKELDEAQEIVERVVTVELSENEKMALTSFTFNLGATRLKKLVSGPSRLNSGNKSSIERILPLYNKADGKVLAGLQKRRAWELKMWRGEKY